jgi:hypothetical protein
MRSLLQLSLHVNLTLNFVMNKKGFRVLVFLLIKNYMNVEKVVIVE